MEHMTEDCNPMLPSPAGDTGRTGPEWGNRIWQPRGWGSRRLLREEDIRVIQELLLQCPLSQEAQDTYDGVGVPGEMTRISMEKR